MVIKRLAAALKQYVSRPCTAAHTLQYGHSMHVLQGHGFPAAPWLAPPGCRER